MLFYSIKKTNKILILVGVDKTFVNCFRKVYLERKNVDVNPILLVLRVVWVALVAMVI